MLEHWSSMVSAVKILKDMSLKHGHYETEILRISDDIDCLNVASSRLENLLGSPTDGIQFNLFGIVDRNEEVLLSVGDELHKTFLPRLAGVETTTEAVKKSVKAFNANVGGDVLKKLSLVENSVKALEATSASSESCQGPTFEQVRKIIIDEIIPAVTDLWDLYMLATAGPGVAVRPGSGKPPGEYLWSKIEARAGTALGLGSNGGTLEQRFTVLEETLALLGVAAAPQLPSIFGVRPQANGGGCAAAAIVAPQEDFASLTASLVGLEAKVKDLDSQLGNSTVTCGSLTF
jgi:hypothetical protein